MEYFAILALICIFISPIYHLILGFLSNREIIKIKLWTVSTSAILLHFGLTFLGIYFMFESLQGRNIRCGLPAAGLLMMSIFSFIVLILIMAVQHYLKPSIRWQN